MSKEKPREIFIHGEGGRYDYDFQYEFAVEAAYRDIWEPETRHHYIEKSAYDEQQIEIERLKEFEWKYNDLCK